MVTSKKYLPDILTIYLFLRFSSLCIFIFEFSFLSSHFWSDFISNKGRDIVSVYIAIIHYCYDVISWSHFTITIPPFPRSSSGQSPDQPHSFTTMLHYLNPQHLVISLPLPSTLFIWYFCKYILTMCRLYNAVHVNKGHLPLWHRNSKSPRVSVCLSTMRT